ncbi:hypothetical protein EK21DRAFT_89935 [Setomelanomma holmii]|uniref:Uncharacterized protein n=1 Tax=Setomelanomma holmii TaxID=210430 RepID=A0A9P4LMR5_9PLEO|nr:hypothetical protein EK21DRAFT_89935 [Setomelanomma holmii]
MGFMTRNKEAKAKSPQVVNAKPTTAPFPRATSKVTSKAAKLVSPTPSKDFSIKLPTDSTTQPSSKLSIFNSAGRHEEKTQAVIPGGEPKEKNTPLKKAFGIGRTSEIQPEFKNVSTSPLMKSQPQHSSSWQKSSVIVKQSSARGDILHRQGHTAHHAPVQADAKWKLQEQVQSRKVTGEKVPTSPLPPQSKGHTNVLKATASRARGTDHKEDERSGGKLSSKSEGKKHAFSLKTSKAQTAQSTQQKDPSTYGGHDQRSEIMEESKKKEKDPKKEKGLKNEGVLKKESHYLSRIDDSQYGDLSMETYYGRMPADQFDSHHGPVLQPDFEHPLPHSQSAVSQDPAQGDYSGAGSPQQIALPGYQYHTPKQPELTPPQDGYEVSPQQQQVLAAPPPSQRHVSAQVPIQQAHPEATQPECEDGDEDQDPIALAPPQHPTPAAQQPPPISKGPPLISKLKQCMPPSPHATSQPTSARSTQNKSVPQSAPQAPPPADQPRYDRKADQDEEVEADGDAGPDEEQEDDVNEEEVPQTQSQHPTAPAQQRVPQASGAKSLFSKLKGRTRLSPPQAQPQAPLRPAPSPQRPEQGASVLDTREQASMPSHAPQSEEENSEADGDECEDASDVEGQADSDLESEDDEAEDLDDAYVQGAQQQPTQSQSQSQTQPHPFSIQHRLNTPPPDIGQQSPSLSRQLLHPEARDQVSSAQLPIMSLPQAIGGDVPLVRDFDFENDVSDDEEALSDDNSVFEDERSLLEDEDSSDDEEEEVAAPETDSDIDTEEEVDDGNTSMNQDAEVVSTEEEDAETEDDSEEDDGSEGEGDGVDIEGEEDDESEEEGEVPETANKAWTASPVAAQSVCGEKSDPACIVNFVNLLDDSTFPNIDSSGYPSYEIIYPTGDNIEALISTPNNAGWLHMVAIGARHSHVPSELKRSRTLALLSGRTPAHERLSSHDG